MSETGIHPEPRPKFIKGSDTAMQIELNRGSPGSHSRHIERKVLTSQNKIEDGDIFPVYRRTDNKMLADIGTNALPDAQVEYLRDQMNDYNPVKQN